MICPNCSREVSQGTIFCNVCGINIPLYRQKIEKRYGKKSEKKTERQMLWDKQNERIKMQIRGWLKENTKNEMYNVQRNR